MPKRTSVKREPSRSSKPEEKPSRKPREAKAHKMKDGPRPRDVALPTEKKKPSTDIRDYSIIIYGPPKIGKTTFLSTFPDILFFLTEPGAKGLPIYEYNADGGGVVDWDWMRQGVSLLESTDRFENIGIDTLDEAYRMCMDWVCKEANVKHPHDANDYGKTWDAVTTEFASVFKRIQRTGRGLYLTSHAKESTIKTASGEEHTRIGPSLTGKAGVKVLALADFIFYVDYMRVDGQDMRVVVTIGDELITAGQRKIGGIGLPRYLPLPNDEARDYETFAAAFRGEVEGLDPAVVRPSVVTAKAAAKSVTAARMEELRNKRKEG